MIETTIQAFTSQAFKILYSANIPSGDFILQKTRKEFEGDYTLNVFPYLKISREKPEMSAEKIGAYFAEHCPEITGFNVIKGFLNIVVGTPFWTGFLSENFTNPQFGKDLSTSGSPVVIEYSSPNTNKPLHLGHIRNNLLGWSVAEILKANGKKVVKVNLVNDRGIHICKSMIAWKKWYDGTDTGI